jgi:uncharacterized protein YjbI with pentapeptide repeats
MTMANSIFRSLRERTRAAGASAAMVALLAFAAGPARAADCHAYAAAGVDWQECSKDGLMLGGSDFSGANLSGTNFSGTDLRNTNLEGANFEKAVLVRSSLAGAKAGKANFARIEAYRTSFAGIAAEGASFASAELQRADFSAAQLTGTDFEKAELGRANFAKAVITGSKFRLANLSRADFSGASFEGSLDFAGAFLFLTRIEGLDLSAATGLEQWQIELACGNDQTKLPAGLSAPANWPCKFD